MASWTLSSGRRCKRGRSNSRRSSTVDECAEIAAQAESAGVRLSGLASGLGWQYPLTSTNIDRASKASELVAGSLRVANRLGIDAILVVPGGVGASFIPGFDSAPYDIAFDNLIAALADLRLVADKTKVAIAIENVWNMFLLSPLEFRDMLDKIGSPFVGCYFDVGNVILTGFPECSGDSAFSAHASSEFISRISIGRSGHWMGFATYLKVTSISLR